MSKDARVERKVVNAASFVGCVVYIEIYGFPCEFVFLAVVSFVVMTVGARPDTTMVLVRTLGLAKKVPQ